MNLRSVDLNLLVLLQALLEERHVSRAARRAGLTQPAMSNALDRCRQLFGDPLLERAGRGMRLTARAESLRAPLASVLAEVGALVDVSPLPLGAIERTVGVVLADVLATVLVLPLLATIAEQAPGLTLAFHGWGGGTAALDQLRRGTVDIAASVLPPTSAGEFHVEPLIGERYVLVGRADLPALTMPIRDRWLQYAHVVVSAEGATRTPVDDTLAARGLTRRVALTLPSFLLVPDLLRNSDLLALMPSLAVSGRNGAGLAICDAPFAVDGFRLDMAWHRRSADDIAVHFVASTVRDLIVGLNGTPAGSTQSGTSSANVVSYCKLPVMTDLAGARILVDEDPILPANFDVPR